MKTIKGRIAVILAVCLIVTGVMPAYAFEDNTILMQEELIEEQIMREELIEEQIMREEIMEEESAEEATTAEAFETVMAADTAAEEIIPEEDDALPEESGDGLLGAGDVTETVTYIDENRIEQQAENCIIISEDLSDYTFETDKWYAVKGTVTVNNRISADNTKEIYPIRLILTDGSTLNAPGGINVPKDSRMIIYGQSGDTGKLICKIADWSNRDKAAIGGSKKQAGGTIEIYGGDITAEAYDRGDTHAAGIGGGGNAPNGKVIIGGGKVTARANKIDGAGIGGGSGNGGTIIITGGEVAAYGCNKGSGIGGGSRGSGGNITITGGMITATGGLWGAGIGGGSSGSGGNITITGGTITATGGGDGAGIGGGFGGNGGNISISGGTITATGGGNAAGIGGGRSQNSGTIHITGGSITATGGDMGAGIGGGYDNYEDYNGTVTINGGSITAFGGNYAAGIGAGEKSPGARGYIIPQILLDGVASVTAGQSGDDKQSVPLAEYLEKAQSYRYVAFDHICKITWKTPGGDVTTGVQTGEIPKFPDSEKSRLVKEGYVFTGWADADGKDVHPAAGDTIYTAQYHIERTLIIDAQGADYEPDTIVYTDENAIVTEPEGPVREGYTFKGWYENVEGSGNAFTFNRTVSETFGANLSLTIYAKWEINSHTIKWKKATASVAYTATSVRYGDTPEYPEEWKEGLKKEGYVFIGWKDEQGQDIRPAKEDKTYIAQYVPGGQSWYLIYDAQGVEYSPDYVEYTKATDTVASPANPEKEGYTFSGWYTDSEGTGTPFEFERTVENTFGANKYLVLYAKWTRNSYTITWMATASDGTGLETIATTSTSYLDVPQLSTEKKNELIQKLSERKLVFTGWADAAGRDVHAATESITYYAQCYKLPAKEYYLILDAQGGNLEKDYAKYAEDDTIVSTPSQVPEKTGYIFKGWSATSSDAGELFVFGRTAEETFGSDKTKTLYAKWGPEAFTITWKKAVDGIEKASSSETYNYGEMPYFKGSFSLDEEGCRFEGWTPELSIVREDRTYITRYQKKDLTVSFDTDGGSFIAPKTTLYGDTIERPATPSKTGYIFKGWYKEDKLTEFDFDTERIKADTTVCAKWTLIEYEITWSVNGNTSTSLCSYGELPEYTGSTERSGYVFTGWNPTIRVVTAAASYIAQYAKISYSGGGGSSGARKDAGGTAGTYSPYWKSDAAGIWRVYNKAGQMITTSWLCDDAVAANGQNVWYLLQPDGSMLSAGLVQDLTGNFYSLETNHNGFFGMLRYADGWYNCNGQQVYLQFSRKHDGTFGAVINADGLAKLKAIYGVTPCGIGNNNCVYTASF